MNRIAAILVGPLLVANSLSVAWANLQETENHRGLADAMGWMVGTWEDADGARTFQWELGDQVITWAQGGPNTARATFFWDTSSKKVRVVDFGAAGWHITGKMEEMKDNSITFSLENVSPSGNKLDATLTYTRVNANEMISDLKVKPAADHDEMLPDQKWTLKRVK